MYYVRNIGESKLKQLGFRDPRVHMSSSSRGLEEREINGLVALSAIWNLAFLERGSWRQD